MTTHQTSLLARAHIALSSFRVPTRALRLSPWRKHVTSLSLCVLSVLCASVVSVALGKFTTDTQNTQSSHSSLIVRGIDQPLMTVILVRHAEKKIVPPENKDPDLSPAGLARAEELVRMFADTGITSIYATQYKRTQQTVKPLSDKLGIPVIKVEAKKTDDLVKQIRSRGLNQVIFIAGHNNSVPEIIAALGGPKLPIIPEDQFDNLYILTVQSDGSTKLVKMKYGNPLPPSGQQMTKP